MPHQKNNIPLRITFLRKDGTQEVFIRGKELGRGSFSIVYCVTHQGTNTYYAMKVISKRLFLKSKSTLQTMRNEIRIQNIVDHPNVVTSQYSFSDKFNYYFALEYCPGKSVRDYLNKRKDYRLKEPEARKILKDVIQGLEYLHGLGITHYDIKLENFVIDSEGNVKIGDFGLSEFHKNEEGKKFDIFGTLNYLSPEMLHKGMRENTSKVDIWAVGVSAFYLLTGKGPFEGKTKEIVFKNIKNGSYEFPKNLNISEDAVDFIKKILQTDPHKRPTAKQLLKHPFLSKIDKETVNLYRSSILPPLKKSPVPQKVVQTELPRIDTNLDTTRETSDHLKTVCGPQINDKISFVPPKKDSLKTYCFQPLNDIKPISPRKANCKINPTVGDDKSTFQPRRENDDLKTFCCPMKNDKESILPRQEKDNLNTFGCPPIDDIKPVSSRKTNDKTKPKCSPPVHDKESVSPRKDKDDLKPKCSPPVHDKESVSPRKEKDDLKPKCSPPVHDKESVSPRKEKDDLKPKCSPPVDDKESVSPRKEKDDLKPKCSPPVHDKESVSPRKEKDDLKPKCSPPVHDKESVSPRKEKDDLKPKCSPPVDDKESVSPRKEKDDLKTKCSPKADNKESVSPRKRRLIVKPVCSPVEEDPDEISPRQKNANVKPVCPPLNDKKSGSPRNSNDNLKPSGSPQQNDVRPISPRMFILPNTSFSPRNSINGNNKQMPVKNFNIPNHFVSRYCFYKDDLGYLLIDGTVGVCFKNKSRIVMDPNEQFAQFYKSAYTKIPEIIIFDKFDEENEPKNVSLVKKIAKNFKKISFSYDLPTSEFEPGVLLHNVVSYVKNEESILFKLDDKNFQANFSDHMKMLIFIKTKKICFFKSIREKCSLLDVKSVASMNSNSDELKKFKNAKIMLSNFAQTIC